MRAIDYSYARPDLDTVRAEGYRIVIRYLSRYRNAKRLTLDEANAIYAAGLCLALVFEDEAMRPATGYFAGAADAQVADGQADALGWPIERAIFYAVDYDADAEDVEDYFRGLNSMSRRPIGVYGSYRIIEGLVGRDHARYGWQCAGWSGPGQGTGGSQLCLDGTVRRRSSLAHLFQDVRGLPPWPATSTDLNHVYTPGLWCNPDTDHQLRKVLTMQSVTADGLEGIWRYHVDGWGAELRVHVDSPPAHRAMARFGAIDRNDNGDPAVCHLTGDEAEWFIGLPQSNPTFTADTGAIALAMQTMAYARELAGELTQLITDVGPVDAAATPAQVAEKLCAFIMANTHAVDHSKVMAVAEDAAEDADPSTPDEHFHRAGL